MESFYQVEEEGRILNVVPKPEAIYVRGALIIGAGPAGLATAACLASKEVPYTILERSDSVASLWSNKIYDRLHLHIPKEHSELPFRSFPLHYPVYPTGSQFLAYLKNYQEEFCINPIFNTNVSDARYLLESKTWRVEAISEEKHKSVYLCKWLIVATGENADPFIPDIPGAPSFQGESFHSSEYRNGELWRGKKVLIMGCGNSGFEVALDLANHGAKPSLVVRSPMHVLPREMLFQSTFVVATTLLRWLPYWCTDKLLVVYANLVMGDTSKWGIQRPLLGPLERKDKEGITPVLDVGTLQKIRSGDIKVVKAVAEVTENGATFADGHTQDFDGIIWATGFRSNVPCWLQDDLTFGPDGLPKIAFPNSWRGHRGLYTVGFTKRGLKGAKLDALQVAGELSKLWLTEATLSPNHGEYSEPDFKASSSSFGGKSLNEE